MSPTRCDRRPAIISQETAAIPLGTNSKDGYAIVDLEFAWLDKYNWHIDSDGYATNVDLDKMHHIIIGKPDRHLCVDHINNNRFDNRAANLRIVTRQQNNMNRRPSRLNTSGFKGVWRGRNNTWQTYICVAGKRIYLGCYKTREQAATKYNDAAIKYFGEYAWLNKIGKGAIR